ncbi:hypothetical protein [Rhodococcus spongiicola]|nr:hypothetical protein [Rhodococcus spongiicola]
MAQKVVVEFIDDLDGGRIDFGSGTSILAVEVTRGRVGVAPVKAFAAAH